MVALRPPRDDHRRHGDRAGDRRERPARALGTVALDVQVVGLSTGGDAAAYAIQAIVEAASCAPAVIGTPTVTVLGENDPTWDVSIGTDTASFATVGGGRSNSATSTRATVGGGQQNTAAGTGSTVAGGLQNLAAGTSSAIGGGS